MMRLLLPIVLLAFLPTGSAVTYTGTSSTGDVDIYNLDDELPGRPLIEACPAIIGAKILIMTLHDPDPVDRVMVSVDSMWAASVISGGQPLVAIATHAQPTVRLVFQVGGCDWDPTITVTGLVVEGEVAYTLDY